MKTPQAPFFRTILTLCCGMLIASCDNRQQSSRNEPSTNVASDRPSNTAENTVTQPAAIEPSTPLREDVRVTDLTFGSEIDKYNVPKERTKLFAPDSKIYAIVMTDGNGPEATIGLAIKNQGGETVFEDTQKLVPNGSWATAFNLSEGPALGIGDYHAETRLDGHLVAEKKFRIAG